MTTQPSKASKTAGDAPAMASRSACRMKGSKSPEAKADANVIRSKACPLVMIEWEDSAQPIAAWSYLASFEAPGTIRCVSVGWLIKNSKAVKALAPNLGSVQNANSVQVSGVIQIPTRCVVRMTRLTEPTLAA